MGTESLFVSMPRASMPQPHWKAAVRTPKAAPTHSTLVTAACSGTSSERKATISTMKLRASTTPITRSRRDWISSARSTLLAVEPPTNAWTSSPAVASGITVERSSRTRSAVSGAAGCVVAMTL